MQTPLIRPCEAADIDMIAGIYAHNVLHGTASFETEPPDVPEMRRRRDDLLARAMPYLVACNGNTVLGYAYAGPYRPRAAYAETVENSVYLRNDAQGCGIGTILLAALIEECTVRGRRQMIAVVGDSANTASIRLHERAGFRSIGMLQAVGWKHGRWLNTVMLQRALGSGNDSPPHPRK